jgi:hypothetical protein
MEDLTPVPSDGVDPELLLAADMTEFYGGTDLAHAGRIVVSQLKYSRRHPERVWTQPAWTLATGAGRRPTWPSTSFRSTPTLPMWSWSSWQDDVVGPLGGKGVGEIGQVGTAAAIADAVFHATGRRIRELPMAPELVMDPISADRV